MIIPKKVSLAGLEFEVVVQKELKIDNRQVLGLAVLEDSKIYLQDIGTADRDLSEEYMKTIFIHELIHHMFSVMDVDVKQEDKICDLMSYFFYQVIKQIEGKGKVPAVKFTKRKKRDDYGSPRRKNV
jgi:hypothetical protein